MRFLLLILRNFRRKKTRTILTVGSIAVALFLYGLLVTIDSSLSAGVEVAGADRLVVRNRISLILPLPLSYRDRLRQIPHCTEVTHASWFGGNYQDPRNFFPQFAIDTETYRKVFPEFAVSDDQWQAFLDDREGAIVGRGTAERFGWKVGDRIPLQAPIWGGTWEFNLRGIYDRTRPGDDTSVMWLHWDYLDERREYGKGMVGWYTVRIDDPANAVGVAAAADNRFANSPFETSTETEKAFATGFARQIGNIRLLVVSIGAVVMFTLLLVTGATMASAVRERVPELGVLKTVGFTDAAVLALVLAESVLLALAGGGLGLGLAKLFTLSGDPTGGMLPVFYLGGPRIALGLGLSVAVGLLAGAVPALIAMRLRIVDAMRRV